MAFAPQKPLGVFELTKLLRGPDDDVRIRSNAKPTSLGQKGARIEDAVAKIRLGHRAKSGDGAGSGHTAQLVGRRMGRVNETPMMVNWRMVEQPLHRP